jgi:hypothetical protein
MLLQCAICGTANYKEQGASYFKGEYGGRKKKELWYGFENFS